MRYYYSPLVWACIILFLSSIPAKELPDFSFWTLFSFDKLAHATLYAILSFQMMRSCIRQYANWVMRYHAWRVTATVVILYGGLVEIYQETVLSDRHGEWMDMVANIAGTFMGIWVFKLVFHQYIR